MFEEETQRTIFPEKFEVGECEGRINLCFRDLNVAEYYCVFKLSDKEAEAIGTELLRLVEEKAKRKEELADREDAVLFRKTALRLQDEGLSPSELTYERIREEMESG